MELPSLKIFSKKIPLKLLFLPAILFIAAFFRYYHFLDYQYLQDDENITLAILTKILSEKKPMLVSPNATIGIPLGPFFQWISLPFFALAKGNPIVLGVFPPFLGIITSWLIYQTGKSLLSSKVGLIGSFFYSTSFLASLFDRRFWALTLDSFLVSLSLFSLLKIMKGKVYFIAPLAISIAFAWNADCSLAVIPIASFIVWLVFKLPFKIKELSLALVIFIFFLLPQIIFEIRHDWVTLKTIPKTVGRFSVSTSPKTKTAFNPYLTIDNFTRLFSIRPSQHIEEYLQYQTDYPKPLFNGLSQFILLALTIFSFFITLKAKKLKIWLLWIFLAVFLFGNLFYSVIMKAVFYQHYFAVILPVFCLLISLPVERLLKSRFFIAAWITLAGIFSINLNVLIQSKIKHPTYQKMKIVELIKTDLKSKSFGFLTSGIHGAGMAYPFLYNDLHPVKSDYHDVWYWIYASYSLFDAPPQVEWPETIVLFKDSGETASSKFANEIKRVQYEDITAIILDNKNQTFSTKTLESL